MRPEKCYIILTITVKFRSEIMTQAINKPLIQEEILLDKFRNLTTEEQQTILDFVEFMNSKKQKLSENQEISAYDQLQEFIGCVDGGDGDLATNKKYLAGFGK
jgi:hypothetical protein